MPRKKRGPGHPVTTGSASVPPVFYRVSKAERAALKQEAKKMGMTINQVAKWRALLGLATP